MEAGELSSSRSRCDNCTRNRTASTVSGCGQPKPVGEVPRTKANGSAAANVAAKHKETSDNNQTCTRAADR